MNSVIFFVLLQIAISLECRPPPCHWSDAKPIENYFDQVAAKVIAADRKLQQFCYKQGGSNVQEVHTDTAYKLVIIGSDAASYQVKIRDRVLLVTSEDCRSPVTELWILPPYVNGYGGSYCTDGGNFVVTFPYKFDPALGGGTCEEVNRSTVTLYQGSCIY